MVPFLTTNVMSVARTSASEDQIRSIVESLLEHSGVRDLVNGEDCLESDGVSLDVYDAPLPVDLRFWSSSEDWDEIVFANIVAYSDDGFRFAINEFRYFAYAVFLFEEDEMNVGCNHRGDLIDVYGGLDGNAGPFTLQETIRRMRLRHEVLGWDSSVILNWKYEFPSLVPCDFNTKTGTALESVLLHSNSDAAYATCKKLMKLLDRPPAFIKRCESIESRQTGDYKKQRSTYSRNGQVWSYLLRGTYAVGFDPVPRPKKVKDEWHFPLVSRKVGRLDEEVDVQLDVVHKPEGTYVELMTGFGPEKLREWTELFPELQWEYWPGDPAKRWAGDPTPIRLPPIKPSPPLMFMTPLDREVRCFIEKRVLTLFIDSGTPVMGSFRWTKDSVRRKREQAGYTREELEHLTTIDMIEARFDEVAARYTDWDRIRFWWPHIGEKAYWDKRPNLWGVKTLPMKVRGKKVQIPVEFVEPLKCPM